MASLQWTFSLSMLCLLVPLLLITTATSSAAPLGPCRYTSYPSLCTALTESFHHRKHPPTAAAIARVSIKATIFRTFQAKRLAVNNIGLNSDSDNRLLRGNLKVCLELYDDAVDNLRQSVANIKAIRGSRLNRGATIDTLKINLSAVITDYTTCDDAFAENPGMKSPLAEINAVLNKLASNNLALASKIPV